jgi:hypothetical protein
MENNGKVEFFMDVLKKEYKPFGIVWPHIEHYLSKATVNPDFLVEFENKIEDNLYAPMFYYSIMKHKQVYTTIAAVENLTNILYKNSELKRLIAVNYISDGLYAGFYRELKANCKKDPKTALMAIRDNVLDFFNGKIKDKKFEILAMYLNMVVSGDYTEAAKLTGESLKMMYVEVNEQGDAKIFGELLPTFLKESFKSGLITPSNIANRYKEYNPDSTTEAMLKVLMQPSKSWLQMMTAVVSEVNNEPFVNAFAIAENWGLNADKFEEFMTTSYQKEYASWKRKNKVKNFFKAIKNFFTNLFKKSDKKKDEEDEKTDEKVDKKPAKSKGKSKK